MKTQKTPLKLSDSWLNEEEELKRVSGQKVIGDFSQISSICSKKHVDRIVVALDEKRGKLPIEQLLVCRLRGIRVDEGNAFTEHLCGRLSMENLLPSSVIFSNGFRRSFIVKKIKRWMDVFISLVSLMLFVPLGLAISMAIKLESKGPIFYRQERIGEEGVTFDLLKFRSMQVDAEENGPIWASTDDKRITAVGRVIRKLHFDETPQIINVLKGEMSFVGPRPERPFFVEKLQKEIPFYFYRHTVKPGITGWAQIYYPYGACKEDALEKLKYDLYYIKHMSPPLDLMILIRTFKIVLWGRGAR
jgi:sugar transferase (PEP-CTERM system associated)